jgi:hypothetical protein
MIFAATRPHRFFRLLLAAFFCFLAGTLPARSQDAASLRERHVALREQLASNQFRRPIHLESRDESGELRGDIYALVEQPYAAVGPALQGMDHWCEMLTLHMNVKSCRISLPPGPDMLIVDIGRKFDQPLAEAYPFEFLYSVVASGPEYLQVVLSAAQGPLGTSRYRIVLEAAAVNGGRSFLHLSYSYAYGMTARAAMQGYLATIGRNKVGFTITGRTPAGEPLYTGGTLGVIERNTMRYYLAIEAYLGALSAPAGEQRELRLAAWYAGVERYPLQLHELDREEYLDMKRNEMRRQQQADEADGN